MTVALNQLGQILQLVDDVDVAEKFYAETLGLRRLYRFGNLSFFDCGGVRLLVEKSDARPFIPSKSIYYFRVADIGLAYRELKTRGVIFAEPPNLVAPMPDHDLWMAFFNDPAGNMLALMSEAPKNWAFHIAESE